MCVSLILSFIPLKTGSPISKLVLLKLADNADARGVCFPSLSYLAQYCAGRRRERGPRRGA